MSLQQLQEYAFAAKYARYSPSLGRREVFCESVERVFQMHAKKFAGMGIDDDIEFARIAALEKLVIGSQRALQFGGTPIERCNARLFNCSVSYCDRPRFFQEALFMLLAGSGVGFSCQFHHVAKLPAISSPRGETVSYRVADSIEGWADALGVLLSSYFTADQPFPEFSGQCVTMDYSLIRPQGALISSGAGTAPGPEPLKLALAKIQLLLDGLLADAGSPCHLRPIDAYDCVMHASDAVLSGGVRRSATIAMFSPDDDLMAKAKVGDWFIKNPQRGRSNNSAVLLRDTTTWEQFAAIMENTKAFGEPGFVFCSSTEVVLNPCCEIGMWPVDEVTGQSGFQVCNLSEINMKLVTSVASFARAAKAAAIIGTLQAAYTDMPYLGEVSERIIRRENLLGISMTGVMDNPALALDPELQRTMAKLCVAENERLAAKIGINAAARVTCIKPSGSASCVLGTSSGIHPHHAKRYFRRVQANQNEVQFQYFKLHNPLAAERSVWSPHAGGVVTFSVVVPEDARTMNEVSAIDLLKIVRSTQENWVMPGRVLERCTQPWLSHNVSNTISVRPEEWDSVGRYIYDHRASFTGVSLLPLGGDLDYPQCPFTSVWTAEEILKEYGTGALFASGLVVDGLHAFGDLWVACSCALGTGETLDLQAYTAGQDLEKLRDSIKVLLAKKDWVRRALQFAKRYCSGDLKRLTYLLKRVSLCKLWEDLQREGVPVDYRLMPELTDTTSLAQAQACSGGQCDL